MLSLIEVKNMGLTYGSRRIFAGVGFEVPPGTLTHIKGPNGVGKSSLLNILAGLQQPSEGEMFFSPELLAHKNIAWLPADANGLDLESSALTNLQFWQDIRSQSTPTEDLFKVAKKWGLQSAYVLQHLRVSLFSTGMKRRLSLARLELSQSKLWLLDEPLFGLDEAACNAFKNSLSDHCHRGGSAILVTHDERILAGIPHHTVQLSSQPI
jgi:heme exporter protein A